MKLAKSFHDSPLSGRRVLYFFYNKLNKLQIKLLWVFVNIDIVLGSIKNKMFLQLSDPLRFDNILEFVNSFSSKISLYVVNITIFKGKGFLCWSKV